VLRQSLVTVQFAVLIGLIVAAIIVYRQRDYAMHDALRLDTDQVLIVRLFTPDAGIIGRCEGALRAELAALAGVRAIGCASTGLLDGMSFGNVWLRDGRNLPMDMISVESSVFNVFGVTPLAGRIPVAEGLAEGTAIGDVVNETAARRLGYAAPGDAIGQLIQFPPTGIGSDGAPPAEIVAVVPDFSLTSVEQEIDPTIYRVVRNPRALNLINIRLTGQEIPETIAGIDRVWESTGALQPIDRFFLDDHIQNLYLGVLRQAQFFSIFSGIAVALAGLGLIGLAASATERRTKEIGIRKATGATSTDILRLLNWEFAKPVLWANLIAWPVAYYAMQRWLEGFAYHIDLELWMFAAAGALALVIALATVSVHSWLVARAKPVTALRYE
jgi:putative ABC transport system permease protein